jgi:citrate lyase subunit beta / citryl-CoA lyase
MRSLLIAPPEEQRLAEALQSGADAIIVDIAQAAPAIRAGARVVAAQFLQNALGKRGVPALIIRTHALDSGEVDADLDAVMAGAPEAILLSGSLGAESVQQLSVKLAVREARLSFAGATRIIAVVDKAQSVFSMGSYRGSSARLMGIAWSAETLRADIGAETDRDGLGGYFGPYRLTRELTLLAATSARVDAIDAVFLDIDDVDGLRAEALAARRDGFAGKLAISAAQVRTINDVFPLRHRGDDPPTP